MSDLLFQNISTVQSNQQPAPNTVASTTAAIAVQTFMTLVSGTVNVGTITPPVSGQHMLALIFTNASPGQIVTTGNILVGSTTVTQNVPVLLLYNPNNAKYYVVRGAVG